MIKATALLIFVLIPIVARTSTTYLLLGEITSKSLYRPFFGSGTVLSTHKTFTMANR